MVFPVLPEFSMAVNKQVKGSEIFNKSETSKDKGKETGKKQGVDESVHKKRTVTGMKMGEMEGLFGGPEIKKEETI